MKNVAVMQPMTDESSQTTGERERSDGVRPPQKAADEPVEAKEPESKPQKIKDSMIRNLEPPKTGARIIWDAVLKGFGVRVTARGVKSFILNYRTHGRQRRYTIGQYPAWNLEAAGAEAARLSKWIDEGFDPLAEREKAREKDRAEPSIADLAREYFERHCMVNNRPSTLRNNRQMLDRIIRPYLGKLRLSELGPRHIEKLRAMLRATPYRANRCRALLSHMFTMAIKWKWVTENPVRGIPRYHEDRRERYLSAHEMRAFIAALDNYGEGNPNGANALRLLLLTGAREGEVLKADWTQFDLERAVWTKPSSHTKEKRTEHVSLNVQTVDVLRAIKPEGATGPVFPGREEGTRVTLRRAWVQTCKRAGLAREVTLKGKRRTITRYKPTLRIHDLRHNFASYVLSEGASLSTVGKLLGHTQAATTERYAHLLDKPQRDATNAFGRIYANAKAEGAPNGAGQGK